MNDRFEANIGEIGVRENVSHTPGMVGDVPLVGGTNRLADPRVSTVSAENILGADLSCLPLIRTGRHKQLNLDRVFAFANLEADEFEAVVGCHLRRLVGHELAEVVEDASLIHNNVFKLGDLERVIVGNRGADNVVRVFRVRLPEGRFLNNVGLVNDFAAEAKSLESFDGAGLHAIRVAQFEARVALLDDAGGDVGEHRKLSCCQHAGGAGADDQNINLVGQFFGPPDPTPRVGRYEGFRTRIRGSVVVELHDSSFTSL